MTCHPAARAISWFMAATVMTIACPLLLHAQSAGPRLAVHAGLGVPLNTRGDVQWLGAGLSINEHVDVLVSVERSHVPTKVSGFSRTRGGTVIAYGGELQLAPVTRWRAAPYGILSVARGTSRLERDDVFPDAVTNSAGLLMAGVGLHVRSSRGLDGFVDVRGGVQIESDVVLLRLPVRAGVTWRF